MNGATPRYDHSEIWRLKVIGDRRISPLRVRIRRLSHLLHKIPHAAAWRLRRLTGRLRARLSRAPRPEGGREGGRA